MQVEKRADAFTNPLLIVEVLSKSTENYGRGQKFVEYQSLPSFREYVLLRQDVPEALIFLREQPDIWRSSEVAGLEPEVLFRSIDVRIPMQAIYDRVEFTKK